MASYFLICFLVLFSFTVTSCYGKVHFSSLNNSISIDASPTPGKELKAGVDKIQVTWGLNPSFPAGTDSEFKTVKVKLCYAPISQKKRAWRKTDDLISKDRTCQFTIVTKAYDSSKTGASLMNYEGVITRNIPTATYFIRAYAYDAHETPLAYGQNTDANKTTNLFDIKGISGRHTSIDICAAVFSGFSVISLFFFVYLEKKKGKKEAQKG